MQSLSFRHILQIKSGAICKLCNSPSKDNKKVKMFKLQNFLIHDDLHK